MVRVRVGLEYLILFHRLYAQFHIQQFASMRKLTTLHCYNIAFLQHGDGKPSITNYSFTSERQ